MRRSGKYSGEVDMKKDRGRMGDTVKAKRRGDPN